VFPFNAIEGAWRIEESPSGHAYGFPNTHWLIVADRIMVIRNRIVDPRVFDMRIYVEPEAPPGFIGLYGEQGGRGHMGIDGDLLFISFGKNGVRPPRFAPDCGLFFAFTRDREVALPSLEIPATDPVTDSVLGRLERDARYREWTGTVSLANGEICEVSISDGLRPLNLQIHRARQLLAWLNDNLPAVKAECGERVREWLTSEDEDPKRTPLEQFSKTVAVSALCADDFRLYLWAHTSLPLDHSIRIWLRTDAAGLMVIDDISVEG
jgi:hypothetical protein